MLLSLLLAVLPQGSITGRIEIHPPAIKARLNYDYVAMDDVKSIDLLINKSFDVRKAACPVCGKFQVDRSDDPATLHIELVKPVAKGAHVALTIEYSGAIAKSADFFELGLDDFWYPAHPHIGEVEFTYAIDLVTNDEDIVTNGVAKKTRRGWRITSRVPDLDMDVVLSRRFDRERDGEIEIVTKNAPPKVPKQLAADIRRVLEFYNATFGASSPQHAVTGVFRPTATRDEGGYFRKGYFLLPLVTNAAAALPNIAHELAHHWWIHANQQNAWLNESFAEYSAMMAIRKLRGQAAFDAIVNEKKERVAAMKLPPIYGFDRTKDRRSTPPLFYAKGPLVLNALEREIGETKFLRLLKRAVDERVVTTDAFVALVAADVSQPAADDFLRRLKE
jgi:hypothetical protein